MANELKTTKLILVGGEPLRLPIRAADPVSGMLEADTYYNSTSKTVRIYDGTVWTELSGVSAAEDVTFDNVASGLTATNVQDAIDETVGLAEAAQADATQALSDAGAAQADATQALADAGAAQADATAALQDAADLATLSGVAANETDLGTFTGVTIPDDSTIKGALQSLETALEALPGAVTVFADDEFRIQDDADATKQLAFSVGSITTATTRTITVPDTDLDLGDIATQAQDIADLVTLSGVAANETDLGTFTGTVIPDDSTIKAALQAVETAAEDAQADATQALSDAGAAQADATQALQDAADLVTLSGVAANSTTLGTFTGDIIPDSSTVKAALQSLETAVETLPDPIVYLGTWSAATNTPALANGSGVSGSLYQVSAAGSVNFGAGAISFEIGDKVVYNGTVWEKWDMTDAVTSVNSQSGAVVLDSDDISEGASNLYFTEARVLGTDLAGFVAGAGTVADTDTVLEAVEKLAGNQAGFAETDLSNVASTSIPTNLIPSVDATHDLGGPSQSWDVVYAKSISGDGDLVTIKGEGLSREDLADTGHIVEQYYHGLSLAANVATYTSIGSLSFPTASYDGIQLEYRLKEATTGNIRIGSMMVASDGSATSHTVLYTETAIVGDDADGEGVKLRATISGGNILIQFKDTKVLRAVTMNVDVKLFVI